MEHSEILFCHDGYRRRGQEQARKRQNIPLPGNFRPPPPQELHFLQGYYPPAVGRSPLIPYSIPGLCGASNHLLINHLSSQLTKEGSRQRYSFAVASRGGSTTHSSSREKEPASTDEHLGRKLTEGLRMSRRITFLGVVRFTDRVLVAGYSPSEADDSLIIKEVWEMTFVVPRVLPSQQ